MTTFTSDDREEAYKKILAEAPNQPGYEDAVPIPFAGWVNTSPPHIVDSGASIMWMTALELANELEEFSGNDAFKYYSEIATMLRQQQAEVSLYQEYVCQLEKALGSSINLNKAQAERQVKELTDEEILQFQDKVPYTLGSDLIEFARAILRKAQEK